MIKTKLFNIPIYNQKVMLVNCDSVVELKEVFKGTDFDFSATYKENSDIYAHTIDGFVEHKECTHHCIYVVFNSKHEKCTLRTKTIAHECIHIINFMYRLKCTKFGDSELDEQDAYLMGYLFHKISKFFKLPTIIK